MNENGGVVEKLKVGMESNTILRCPLYNPMKKYIPIPSISDVLQKLNKRFEILPDYYNKKHFDRSLSNIWKNYLSGKFSVVEVHYWLLSALCEVLKEGE